MFIVFFSQGEVTITCIQQGSNEVFDSTQGAGNLPLNEADSNAIGKKDNSTRLKHKYLYSNWVKWQLQSVSFASG